MPNIFELFNAKNVRYIYEEDKNRAPYIGEALFPNVRQRGINFSFIKGKQGTPVALVSANWNTNVLYRDRIGVEAVTGKMPFFKEAYAIDEEQRQELLSVKDEYAQPIIDRIYADQAELLAGADATAERMRMQLLSTGTISIVENGVNKQYDYGFDSASQFKELATKWSSEEADPIADINKYKAEAEKATGETPAYIVMDNSLFNVIAGHAKTLAYFKSLLVPVAYPTKTQVREYITNATELQIIISDKKFREARKFGASPIPFYPTDRFTFLSTLDLGETMYGTTPEEADLLNKSSKASSVEITSKGVAITTWNQADPVNVNTKVSEVVLPSCPNIGTLYIVKCL